MSSSDLMCGSILQQVDNRYSFSPHPLNRKLRLRDWRSFVKDSDLTTLWCWHDRHPIHLAAGEKSDPIPLPRDRNPLTNEFEVEGVVCSLRCQKAYLIYNWNTDTPRLLALAQAMALEVYGAGFTFETL